MIPEVVQTSATDCGPAALTCLLEGFGISASYGRLREACQTDVDGTSIDALEVAAQQLGLDAEQIMLPADALLLPEACALPALLVVRLPNGFTHFVVVWRRYGRWVQIMDPAIGRRWIPGDRLLRETYEHSMNVPADGWREWAGSDESLVVLRARLRSLGIRDGDGNGIVASATADPTWRSLATLDAALRLTTALAQAGGVRRGESVRRFLDGIIRRARVAGDDDQTLIPDMYWSVRPADEADELRLRGAVLLRVRGRQTGVANEAAADAPSPTLASALTERPPSAMRELYKILKHDGATRLAAITGAAAIAAAGVTIEALVLRGVLGVGTHLGLVEQRLLAAGFFLVFLVALLALDLGISASLIRLGRRADVRLRAAFLAKIPLLSDRYVQTRPVSDLAERGHAIHNVRQLPRVAGRAVRTVVQMIISTAALLWLAPGHTWLIAAFFLASIGIPLVLLPSLQEQDLRIRTHNGGLGKFYLDSLLGLAAVRSHGAEHAMRREHEGLLVEWMRAGRQRIGTLGLFIGAQTVVTMGIGAWLIFDQAAADSATSTLLLFYWVLLLPTLGIEFGFLAQQYPVYRSTTLRLVEPLNATTTRSETRSARAPRGEQPTHGARIVFERISVRAGGHLILEDVDACIEAGEHVAVVGRSGAGKSSLLGVLLGWHTAGAGRVVVDGHPLDAEHLDRLRRDMAWLDPAVHLWNRSLLDNLTYGNGDDALGAVGNVLDAANLHAVVDRLPDGLQTPLGEGGGLLAGGEGQRVRVGRALLRETAKLVIIDEPFRGLDRDQRRDLLGVIRRRWAGATLLCATHDLGETMDFDRVLVLESGRLVEDGVPAVLATDPESRYATLLRDEEDAMQSGWASPAWRHIHLRAGRLSEADRGVGS